MIGVLCGIEREAAIIRRGLGDLPHLSICTGARAENAARGAQELVDAGAERLLSFGLAGALSDDLHPGDLLTPETVIDADKQSWGVDSDWLERVRRTSPEAIGAPLLGIDSPARTAAQKLFLRAALDAAAVDMESHFVARSAAKAGLPFLVIRAVADDSRTSLPDAAMSAVSPEGRELPMEAAKALLRRPREIGPLIRLARASGKGFGTLRRVAGLGLGL